MKWANKIGVYLIIITLVVIGIKIIFNFSQKKQKQGETKTEQQAARPKKPVKPLSSIQLSTAGIAQLAPGQRAVIKKANGEILRFSKGDYFTIEVLNGRYWKLAVISDSKPRLQLRPMKRIKTKFKMASVAVNDFLTMENTGQEIIRFKLTVLSK